MTPKQFWDDDPDDLWAYWEAYQENQKEMVRMDNIRAFNQGQYILCAIAQCLQSSKNPKQIFPKKPFPLSSDKKEPMTQKEYEEIRKIQLQELEKRFNSSR